MNIASIRIDELVHLLARLTGEDVETALERAVQERLARIVPVPEAVDRRAALDAFLARAASLPVLDNRSPDEIVGCGPDGSPD